MIWIKIFRWWKENSIAIRGASYVGTPLSHLSPDDREQSIVETCSYSVFLYV